MAATVCYNKKINCLRGRTSELGRVPERLENV